MRQDVLDQSGSRDIGGEPQTVQGGPRKRDVTSDLSEFRPLTSQYTEWRKQRTESPR